MDDSKPQTPDVKEEGRLRAEIAKLITRYAFIFIAGVALVTLIAAGIYSYYNPDPKDAKRGEFFFEVAKYLLGIILPVVAGWVGTVLAFYYGKENFEAGTRSVAAAASVLTSKDKLASTPASTLGIARTDFKALSLTADESKKPEEVHLDRIEAGFATDNPKDKPYERLPVLLAGEIPYMVLHKSTLNSFLVDKKREEEKTLVAGQAPKDAKDYTLGDLFKKVDYLPKNSIAIVGPLATAADAKAQMEKIDNCSDVIVTADGKPDGVVTRWITNVELLNAAQV